MSSQLPTSKVDMQKPDKSLLRYSLELLIALPLLLFGWLLILLITLYINARCLCSWLIRRIRELLTGRHVCLEERILPVLPALFAKQEEWQRKHDRETLLREADRPTNASNELLRAAREKAEVASEMMLRASESPHQLDEITKIRERPSKL